jgi:osmotically-inducible protein OsmY
MRRFLFSAVIASVTAAMPAWALGGDREIAQAIMTKLQEHKSQGSLKGFDIDLKVERGIVYLEGKVKSQAQRALVAYAAGSAPGVSDLVNNLAVEADDVEQAYATASPGKSTQGVIPVSGAQPQPSAADVAITDSIIAKLQREKQSGTLRGFELDVSTVSGDVWLRGKVANVSQKDHVLNIVRRVRGVRKVVDDVSVTGARSDSKIRPVSTEIPTPIPDSPKTQTSSMPVMGGGPMPRAFAPSGLASYQGDCVTDGGVVGGGAVGGAAVGGGAVGGPVPMQGAGMSYGAGAPRYDQPNMPSYAWPSYAAYPNYAAVTYPKQYSPSAWPYIGPFYPYPQVPLGWRKVALEWDDGLWYLNFTSKR